MIYSASISKSTTGCNAEFSVSHTLTFKGGKLFDIREVFIAIRLRLTADTELTNGTGSARSMEPIRRKLLLCVSAAMGEVSLPVINCEKWVNVAHG